MAFFFLSNPLALQPNFGISFERAGLVIVAAMLITRSSLRLPRVPWAILLLLLTMAASSLWSISPSQSWGVFEFYLKIAVLGFACAACAPPRTIAFGMAAGGAIVVAASIYAYVKDNPLVLVPPGADGYLAGVGTNRNILSYTLVLSFAAAIAAVPRQWWARAVWAVMLASISVGLFLSQSGTGFVATGILLVGAGALSALRRWRGAVTRRGRRYVSLAAALAVVAGVAGWPALGALLGRDSSTLSGRTDLWGTVWRASAGDRWLGQGWGTVWPHPWAPAAPNHMLDVIYTELGDLFAHGHNSLFDVLPELGLLGVLLVVVAHLTVLYRGWSRTQTRADSAALDDHWAAARLSILGVLGLALCGVTEPMVTIPLGWFVLSMLSVSDSVSPARHNGSHVAGAQVTDDRAATA
ncbi:O-antigen ligase family protein [Nocardioides hwasunensis]|uniref:O-antigen ligase family protein n=1 Tax=Nocardioides hwasunensis TaxID=397258 RepID=UPI001747AE17|nr:O-antigen ligase family protein [Nocardioides hwasunensis]